MDNNINITLLDILTKYIKSNGSTNDSRLTYLIDIVIQLKSELTKVYEKLYKNELPEEYKKDDSNEVKFLSNFIVLWYHAPISKWKEETYAVFLTSCLEIFFNPTFHDENYTLKDKYSCQKFDDETEEEMFSEFGRLMKYLYKENISLHDYFDQLIGLGSKSNINKNTLLGWHPLKVSQFVYNLWNQCKKECNEKGRNKDENQNLFECIMKKNIDLLQIGIGIKSPIIAWMLIHYYNVILKSYVDKRTKLEEEEDNDLPPLECIENNTELKPSIDVKEIVNDDSGNTDKITFTTHEPVELTNNSNVEINVGDIIEAFSHSNEGEYDINLDHKNRYFSDSCNPKLNCLNHGDNIGGMSYMLQEIKKTYPSEIDDTTAAVMTDQAFNIDCNTYDCEGQSNVSFNQ